MSSERVKLRPLREEDTDLLYEWITDRNLVMFNSSFKPISENEHSDWMLSVLKERNDLMFFVIEDLDSSTAIGTCQLTNINWIHRNAELQIRIGNPDYQGRGLGSEAVRLLCEFGFHDLNLHRIHLQAWATNTRAIAAYQKVGFKQEGEHAEAAFIDGRFIDVVTMALLKSDVSKAKKE